MNPADNDREVAAAWRAASRDEPPGALDDALRAAARRAVGAGPARAKHMRTWPLAAAAVMAVFAIGLLQLTPPEQVTPGLDADSSSPRQKLQDAAKPAGTAAPVVAEPAKNDAPVTVAANSGATDAGSAKRDAPVSVPASPAASGAVSPTPRAPVAAPAKRNPAEAEAPQRSAAVADGPTGERFAARARKELAQAPAPEPEAKPQSPSAARLRDQTRGDAADATAETGRELDKKSKPEASARQEAAEAAAKARAEPFPATAAKDKFAAAAPAAPAPAPPPALAAAPAQAPAPAPPPAAPAMNRPAPAPAEMTGALSAQRSAGSAALAEKLAKDTVPRPADEWIKLIRKLQSEGRNDEAVKELKEFRAAYKERADALLPPDLRAIKP
ncbi:MAG: hypothetical protein ABI537_00285 [Casimicrobiaceae bacterium]